MAFNWQDALNPRGVESRLSLVDVSKKEGAKIDYKTFDLKTDSRQYTYSPTDVYSPQYTYAPATSLIFNSPNASAETRSFVSPKQSITASPNVSPVLSTNQNPIAGGSDFSDKETQDVLGKVMLIGGVGLAGYLAYKLI